MRRKLCACTKGSESPTAGKGAIVLKRRRVGPSGPILGENSSSKADRSGILFALQFKDKFFQRVNYHEAH